jgi:hypothetical protein
VAGLPIDGQYTLLVKLEGSGDQRSIDPASSLLSVVSGDPANTGVPGNDLAGLAFQLSGEMTSSGAGTQSWTGSGTWQLQGGYVGGGGTCAQSVSGSGTFELTVQGESGQDGSYQLSLDGSANASGCS